MPSGAVEQQRGMRAGGGISGDFGEMQVHRISVAFGQDERRALAARRADRAEKIGVLIALIGRLARKRAALGPLPDKAVVLADAGFILEPGFHKNASGNIGQMRLRGPRDVFL